MHIINNGGEYLKPFDANYREKWIRYQKSPQLNGVVERMNKTLVERFRCFLLQLELPQSFSGKALRTIIHVLNLSQCVS